MNSHIVVYRTESTGRDRLGEFLSAIEEKGALEQWTGSSRFDVGDLSLFYFTRPTAAVMAVGFVKTKPLPRNGQYDWRKGKGHTFFCDFRPVWLLEQPLQISKMTMGTQILEEWWTTQPIRHSQELPEPVTQELVARIIRLNPELQGRLKKKGITVGKETGATKPRRLFTEGGTREVVKELKQRDPRLKAEAVATYGYRCMVCRLKFAELYGNAGEAYIELHHLEPISQQQGEYHPTVNDVAVVCANCHRVLHKNGATPMPWKDLRRVVQKRQCAGGPSGHPEEG